MSRYIQAKQLFQTLTALYFLILLQLLSCNTTKSNTQATADAVENPSMLFIQLAVSKADSAYTVSLIDKQKIDGQFMQRFNAEKPNGWTIEVLEADKKVFSASVADPIARGVEVFSEEGEMETMPLEEGIISFRMPGDIKFNSLRVLNQNDILIASMITQ